MKTDQEYINDNITDLNKIELIDLLNLLQEVKMDYYNQAIQDSIAAAEVTYVSNGVLGRKYIVDTHSISKLLKK